MSTKTEQITISALREPLGGLYRTWLDHGGAFSMLWNGAWLVLLLAMMVALSTVSVEARGVSEAAEELAKKATTKHLFEAYIKDQRDECKQIENGDLSVNTYYLDTSVDFDGDGNVDPMFDTAGLDCSTTTGSFSGGTGGTTLSVFLSGNSQRAEFRVLNHMVLTWPRTPVLLVALHGSACGRYGTQPCHAAYSFSDGSFATINQK